MGLGAVGASVVPFSGVLVLYGVAGAAAFVMALALPDLPLCVEPAVEPRPKHVGIVERLAALFALDAFAGGFVVQAFIAYWLSLRFGVGPETIGPLLFAANVLAALSYLVADRIPARIGLLNPMGFTHPPSHELLVLGP